MKTLLFECIRLLNLFAKVPTTLSSFLYWIHYFNTSLLQLQETLITILTVAMCFPKYRIHGMVIDFARLTNKNTPYQ